MLRNVTIFLTILFCQFAFANMASTPINWPTDDKGHLNNPAILTESWSFAGKLTATKKKITKQFAYFITLRYMRDLGKIPTLDVRVIDLDTQTIYGNSMQLKDAQIRAGLLQISAHNFYLQSKNSKYYLKLTMPAQDGPIGFYLTMTPKKSPLFVGNNAHRYEYIIPSMQTTGSIDIGPNKYSVNPDVRFSSSWMDHQWGDFSL